jgi:hypothetical protein
VEAGLSKVLSSAIGCFTGGERELLIGRLVVFIDGPGIAADLMLYWGELPERWEAAKLQDCGRLAH